MRAERYCPERAPRPLRGNGRIARFASRPRVTGQPDCRKTAGKPAWASSPHGGQAWPQLALGRSSAGPRPLSGTRVRPGPVVYAGEGSEDLMWRRLVVLAAALAVSVPRSIAVAAASASAPAPTCNRAAPMNHRPRPGTSERRSRRCGGNPVHRYIWNRKLSESAGGSRRVDQRPQLWEIVPAERGLSPRRRRTMRCQASSQKR